MELKVEQREDGSIHVNNTRGPLAESVIHLINNELYGVVWKIIQWIREHEDQGGAVLDVVHEVPDFPGFKIEVAVTIPWFTQEMIDAMDEWKEARDEADQN